LVQPVSRLAGVIVAAAAGAGLYGFLLVWLLSALLDAAVTWWQMLRTLRRLAPDQKLRGTIAGVTRENPGIVSFVAITNFDLTLTDLVPKAIPLIVGALLGPAAAGIYSLAQRAGVIFQQPALLLNQAGYTVIVRLLGEHDHQAARRVVWQNMMLPFAVAVPILVAIGAFAREIMTLLGGESFQGGVAIVVLLAAARAVELGRSSFAAGLSALGRPSRSILVSIVTGVALLPLLPLLIHLRELNGVGWHSLIQAFAATVAMGILFEVELGRAARGASTRPIAEEESDLAKEELNARPQREP
jgi:O-antigen/teichoic acid export membrane protein